jgi:predicted transcriptional regulator
MRAVVGIRPARKGKSVSRGERDPRPTVLFDSWRQLAGVLSDENRQLLRVIRDNEPRTVMELAQLSGRAASNLSRTLRTLEAYGLVKLHRSTESRAVKPEALATEFLVVLD